MLTDSQRRRAYCEGFEKTALSYGQRGGLAGTVLGGGLGALLDPLENRLYSGLAGAGLGAGAGYGAGTLYAYHKGLGLRRQAREAEDEMLGKTLDHYNKMPAVPVYNPPSLDSPDEWDAYSLAWKKRVKDYDQRWDSWIRKQREIEAKAEELRRARAEFIKQQSPAFSDYIPRLLLPYNWFRVFD